MKNETTGDLEYVELDLKENANISSTLSSANITNTTSVSTKNSIAITSTTTATSTKTTGGLQLSTVDTRLRIASKDIRNSGMGEDGDEKDEQVSQICFIVISIFFPILQSLSFCFLEGQTSFIYVSMFPPFLSLTLEFCIFLLYYFVKDISVK